MSRATATEPVLPVALADRLAEVVGLLREVGDLKRVRTAGTVGSVADRAFARAWSALVDGTAVEEVAAAEAGAAVAGARLAGIDADVLAAVGLSQEHIADVRARAIDEVADGSLQPRTLARLHTANAPVPVRGAPSFVRALCEQPRAGATAPGRPRLIVEPPEDHGEHCWAVAVYGWLLADDLDADPADAFLLGLAHHLHNAVLPDAGFAGEMLLGEHLTEIVTRLTEAELATLPAALADRVRRVLAARADAATPLGRAFHAADVLDRVLQVHHHARAAAFTARDALVDLELVHASPVSDYHHKVLTAAGLAP